MEKDDFKKLIAPLEDFSKNPPSDLWEAIEEKLEEPKKKRAFAYWWSVAASLIVGLGLLGAFYFQSSNEKHTDGMPLPVTPQNGIVNQSRSLEENSPKQEFQAEDKNQNNQIVYPKSNKENNNQAEENLTHSSTKKGSRSITSPNSHHQLVAATTSSKVLNAEKEQQNHSEINTITNPVLVQENPNSVVEKSATENPNNAINPKEDLKQNALAALANENQKKEKKSTVEDRWSLQLFAGINNSQNLKNQKSLGNSIESQKGYNYGVKTNYKLNKRWAVSTGLKVSELGQQVANVSYLNASQSLVNVNQLSYAAASHDNQGITTNSNYIFVSANTNYEKSNVSPTFYESGNLSQRVQYIEMPMEISYSILNKGKARLNLNTGGFVGRVISNKVALDNTTIGKNSDVNETVFGTVLSSTLQYELYKKTRVFVEPGMNFYTQPVQNQNFNQFQMLLNFGFNISF